MTTGIRLDGFRTDTSLADVFDLPAGYRCVSGFLVTYDLSVDTLCRDVLVPLAGLEPGPLEVLQREAPPLTVICQRPWPGPMLPKQVRVVTWPHDAERPLHVKAGLLCFEPEHGNLKTLVRAYIGSTNLTEGGFGRNRELLAWTEDGRSEPWHGRLRAAVGSICRAVAAAAVAAGCDTTPPLKTTLDDLLGGFGEPLMPPSSVRHTINDSRTGSRNDESRRVLADVPRPVGFDRLDVISPPYWDPHTGGKVAEALRDVLPKNGTVRLLTSTPAALRADEPVRVAFPQSLVRALEQRELAVEVGAVTHGRGDDARDLHAKLYVLHGRTRSTLLLGSANATVSGLAGRNREAVVLFDLPRADAEALVEASGPWHTDLVLDEAALGARADRPEQPPVLAGVTALFTPDENLPAAGRGGRYLGSMVIAGLPAGAAVRIRHAGGWVDAQADAEGRVDLAAAIGTDHVEYGLDQGMLYFEVDGREQSVLVIPVMSERWLDAQIARLDAPPQVRESRHPLELQLFADLRLLERARRAGAPGRQSQGYGAAVDDRLTLPIYRRLQTILSYYRRLASSEIADDRLIDYLDADDVADPRVQVAQAALNPELDPAVHDELIVALNGALQAEPAEPGR